MAGRRLLIFVAIVMGLTAVVASITAPQPQQRRAQPTAEPSVPTIPTEAAEREVERTITAGTRPVRIRVRRGDDLELNVENRRPDAVMVGEDGPIDAVDAASPAQFDLVLDEPGSIDVRLLSSGRLVARVDVVG